MAKTLHVGDSKFDKFEVNGNIDREAALRHQIEQIREVLEGFPADDWLRVSIERKARSMEKTLNQRRAQRHMTRTNLPSSEIAIREESRQEEFAARVVASVPHADDFS